MKPFILIGSIAIVCIAALVVLQKAKGVSVDVLSCDVSGGEAAVRLHYANRLTSRVTLSFDVALTGNGTVSRFGGSGVRTIKTQHVAGVGLGPKEIRDQTLQIPLPPRELAADVVILNISISHTAKSTMTKRPNQAPVPTSGLRPAAAHL